MVITRSIIGAVHILCHTILTCSGPPPPSVILRHNLAYPPTPHMYDVINEYVISLSDYFSDIVSNG